MDGGRAAWNRSGALAVQAGSTHGRSPQLSWERGGVCRLALSMLLPTILLVSCGESDGGPSRSGSVAVEAPSSESWQTIEHRGVQVDIPATWERMDTSTCEFEIARWGDPAFSPCEFEHGVTFYGSALFDPAHGPGVVRSAIDRDVMWSGYAYAGDYAVYVFDNDDRQLVRDILASARKSDRRI